LSKVRKTRNDVIKKSGIIRFIETKLLKFMTAEVNSNPKKKYVNSYLTKT